MAETVDSITVHLSDVLTIEEATRAASIFDVAYPDGVSAEYIMDRIRMKLTLDGHHG